MAITQCPECGGKVSTRATVCPHCGCPVGPQITCPDCGENFAASLTACPECGGPVEAPEDPQELPEPLTLAASPKAIDAGIAERAANAMKDDKKHGPWETYDSMNGQLRLVETYKDGELHGPFESYNKRGQLERKGTYCVGFPCGKWFEEGETKTYAPCPRGLQDVTATRDRAYPTEPESVATKDERVHLKKKLQGVILLVGIIGSIFAYATTPQVYNRYEVGEVLCDRIALTYATRDCYIPAASAAVRVGAGILLGTLAFAGVSVMYKDED